MLTEVQHVHVVVADGRVPPTEHVELPFLHHTCRVAGRETEQISSGANKYTARRYFRYCHPTLSAGRGFSL